MAISVLKVPTPSSGSPSVEVAWIEGDAEALPFEDDAFDRVCSTFGHIFAPRHRQAADARQILGERFTELRAEIIAIWTRGNESADGRFVFPQEYLLSVIRV